MESNEETRVSKEINELYDDSAGTRNPPYADLMCHHIAPVSKCLYYGKCLNSLQTCEATKFRPVQSSICALLVMIRIRIMQVSNAAFTSVM